MKFWEIFRFEFAYQVCRIRLWLFAAVLVILNFLMIRDKAVSEALFEEFFINAPFFIATTTVFGGLIWLMMAASVAGDAAARDLSARMHPLIYTISISKAEYLGGRFFAAFVLNILILLSVQAGILLGVYLPGVDPSLIGPFRPAAYLTAYTFLALPNAFVGTALQFWLATASGRAMSSYFGSFILFFMGFFVASFILFSRELGTLLDPIGIRFIVEDIAHLWTTIEKNGRLLTLEGIVLTNRIFWMGIGLVAVAITYLGFGFTHRTDPVDRLRSWWAALWWRSHQRKEPTDATAPSNGVAIATSISVTAQTSGRQTFGLVMHARQVAAITWASFKTISLSWGGLALLIFIPLLTIPVVVDQLESNGVRLIPTTARVISELTAPLSAELSRWVIVPALLIFFAGELVWREREARLGEITGTLPGSEWSPFLGKFMGLVLLLVAFTTLQISAGMIAQSTLGFYRFDVPLYLKSLLGLQLPEYVLFALLVLVIHVIVNQKYTGHLVAILAYIFIALSGLFGVEHNLMVYGAGPAWSYTEMRGFGASLLPWLWFKLYWAAWALLLAVVARLLWVRGKETALRFRLQAARHHFSGATRKVGVTAGVIILALGSFIFYNTNILNKYLTTSESKKRKAEYEQLYGLYDAVPQPEATHVTVFIEIYPENREAEIRGSYTLLNRGAVAIDSIHVATVPGVTTETVFDRPATLLLTDAHRGHRIYTLENALQPDDSIRLNFKVEMKPRGFRESGIEEAVASNGTFFMNKNLFPRIGYQRDRELITAGDRREHGLTPRPLIAFLNDEESFRDRGRGPSFDAVIGTHPGQIAVAPGKLIRTWTDTAASTQGRRYFQYTTSAIGDEWSFFSARYALHETEWLPSTASVNQRAVMIRIYHHPGHTLHIDRMVSSIRASLDYYTKNFGPYKRDYLTVVERSGNGTGMHADAGMLSHGEGFTFWNPGNDARSHDHPFAIVAHEMAHQWTVPYANVEGAPVMSESIAWYYGMKVVEHARGPEALRGLHDFMWQPNPYSPILRGEPLLRGLDPYISYRKGPFALYTMSEYLGEDRVNGALRRMLEKHKPVDAPLATTLDLYRALQEVTPDSLRYLLHDLFEVNTYWKLKTSGATATRLVTGEWQVTLEIDARKIVVDSAGMKTDVTMDEWIPVAVFGSRTSGEQNASYLQMHRIRSGRQTIDVTVPTTPSRAGIDPGHILDWEERSEDNLASIKIDR